MTQSLINPAIPSGPYTATWNGLNIGLFEGPIRLQQRLEGIPVRASQWGQTIIDWVLQGGGCYGLLVIKEWTANTKRFMWPFGNGISNAADLGLMPRPGRVLSQYCAPIVFTALTGSQAATYGPVTRTYPYVTVLPTHNLEFILAAMERNVVIAVACLPVIDTGDATGQARFYTDT